MREWLDEDREVRQQQQKLEERAEEWEQSRKAKGFLLQGLPLQNAIQVDKQAVLNASTKEFIKKSQQKQLTSRFLIFGLLIIPSFTLLILLPIFVVTQASAFITNKSCNPNPNAKLFLQVLMSTGFKKQLRGANLCGQTIGKIDLGRANFAGANFENSNLSEAILRESNLQNTSFKESTLIKTDFQGSMLENANFEGAILEGTLLNGSYLGNASFKNTDLKNANLKGSILIKTNLKESLNLTETQINEALLCETLLPNKYIKKFKQDRDCTKIKELLK
jgi:hypothetical protein